MRKTKSLAFKREKPTISKNLFFSTLAFMAAITACAPTVTALPRREIRREVTISESIRRAERSCKLDARDWLMKGERLKATVCRNGRLFALTDTSLLIGTEVEERTFFFSDITLESSHSRTDMRGILKAGLVDWTASEDTAYFLTRDRMLTPIPVGEMGDEMTSYEIPAAYVNGRITFHNEFLLIAGAGRMMAISFDPILDSRELPLRIKGSDADFFQNGGKLYFGNEREKVEIIFESSRLSDIRLR